MPMASFEPGDVVKVPFPYTDRSTRKSRPALVVSSADFESTFSLLWVLMITSAENRGWPSDVPIANLGLAGLPAPSVVRPSKIATIDATRVQRLGALPRSQLERVMKAVAGTLHLRV